MADTCGNCGAPISRRIRTSRVVACSHCNTTQVYADRAFHTAGEAGQMHDAPMLLVLGRESLIAGRRVTPVGHLRFSYGPGWWDEFWCTSPEGQGWISVDEGDVAVERALPRRAWPRGFVPRLGATLDLGGERYTVTEAETARCIAMRGELPEEIALEEAHQYYDLSGAAGGILTCELWEGGEAWYAGQWIDPWTVRGAGTGPGARDSRA